MLTYKEKLNMLNDMIALSKVDGIVHEKEMMFINLIAEEFHVRKEDVEELYHSDPPRVPIKSEFKRIEQFYRLALLMHSDSHKHEDEVEFLKNMAINLGLNPMAVKKVVQLMDESPNNMLEPEVLINAFKEQHN